MLDDVLNYEGAPSNLSNEINYSDMDSLQS